MASSGTVVADSNQDQDKSHARASVPLNPTQPKPEVARKPKIPGSKPCPPVPKKPPVAHKPSALSPSNGNTVANSSTSCTSSSAPSKLSPSAHPNTVAQGTAPSPATQSTDSPSGTKVPPPPLPKAPPKGVPPPTAKRSKEPPPRPSPLPAAKKTGPPVPAKKPFARKPAVPEKSDRSSSLSLGQSGFHEQVVDKGTDSVEVDEEQQPESQQLNSQSPVKSAVPTPKKRSYQKVVVAENSEFGAKNSLTPETEENRTSVVCRQQSYENVTLGEDSQNTPLSDPSRSSNVVLEKSPFESDTCDRSATEGEVKDSDDKNNTVNAAEAPTQALCGLDYHVQQREETDIVHVSGDKSDSNDSLTGNPVHHKSDSKLNCDENDRSSNDSDQLLSDKQDVSVNERREQEEISGKVEEPSQDLEEKSQRKLAPKKTPPRPTVAPPPVRPKPRKRVSLVKQTEVSEDDSLQSNPSTANVAESHSSSTNSTVVSGTFDTVEQESVYQEIDELERPASKGTEAEKSSVIDGIQNNKEPTRQNQEQNSSLRTKENLDTKKDNVQEVTEKFESVDDKSHKSVDCAETSKDLNTDSPGTDIGSISRAGEKVEGGDQKGASVKSAEKQESFTLEDVGETSFMLKEIEQLLNERLGSTEALADTEPKASDSLSINEAGDAPIRPPRPKRADKLRKLTIGSCSADSSSTESLTSVGLPGKKAPPKPKRKHLPGAVNRSLSDVTGMKGVIDQLDNYEGTEVGEEKPYLPPRQQSLRHCNDPKPPPLPPRNKSMEQIPDDKILASPKTAAKNSKEEQPLDSSADRRASAPNIGEAAITRAGRSASGARPGRKHMPRPTRKAPPPPSQPPSRPLSMTPSDSSASAMEPSAEKVPGYQKIVNGLGTGGENINIVVPKSAVVGSIDSPSGPDVSTDHDYHEIPEHLVKDLSQETVEEVESQEKSKEKTPPPSLPPRSYKPPSSEASAPTTRDPTPPPTMSDPSEELSSEQTTDGAISLTESLNTELGPGLVTAESEAVTLNPPDGLSDQLSAEDSTSQSSQRSSRPDSFCSEVLGSLLHVVGERHRPVSTHSGSSHSETGSGEVEVPTFDQSSGSESEIEEDEERMKRKREKKVYYIAEEVVKSEKVFVDVLKLLNVDFRVFMSTKTEQAGHAIVPSETLNKILDFLPQLQSFNEMLLKDLTDRIANWENQRKIADIFVKKGPFLKLYSSYIRNFENATALLDETCKKHNGFGMALQQFEMSPRCASLALKHYMLKPIQRIPQYKLLLQDYLKHLTPECPDYKDTITALNIVSEVADHANESMRHGDNVQKMLEIQRSLIGQFEVIQPGRVLIRQGELMKLSRKEMQPRMFFLFSDVLLYTTPTTTGYRLNNILPLQGMKVIPPKLEEFSNEFNIITTQRSFTVATSTPEEREEWLRALWNAIEENSERYHTFKAMQSEPKTSLLDKDFVLGSKAPLWVPDARVTMCMVCLAEFSITWRRHHCRACGRIICGNCSENRAPLRYLMYKPARVCDECFPKLEKEVDDRLQKEQKRQSDKSPSLPSSPTIAITPAAGSTPTTASSDSSGLSFSSIKARFQKIRKSARERRKSGPVRPSVLKEVHANDEGSDMSGYLWVAKNKKWKRLWFVVKGKVLYTYKASEDMAAIESMPLLGFEVTRMTAWYQGAEPDLMFELHHQNTQPLVFKTRSASSSSSERNSVVDDSKPVSPSALSPHVKSSADTTTPRLIFRTDSAAATTKWLTVLREASLA